MKEGLFKRGKNQKGQVTIFVILAIVIVVAGILIYFYYPTISSTSNSLEENPKVYLQNCVEDVFLENTQILSSQGGSMNPTQGFIYKGDKVEYLCYTNQYYDTCVVQKVSLISNIEEELKLSLKQKVSECFSSMKADYEKKDYNPVLKNGDFSVDLLPKKIVLHSNSTLTLSKDSTVKYESFDVVLDNNLYELASTARVIVNWEKNFGDSEVKLLMDWDPSIKVEKKLQSDGTKIYIVTDRNTEDKFQFASRSVVWPPGISTI